MKKLVSSNSYQDSNEFKPKHIELEDHVKAKLDKILKSSKSNSTTKVIKTWLMKKDEPKDLYS